MSLVSRLLRRTKLALRGAAVSPPFVGVLYLIGLVAYSGTRAGVDADVGDVRRAEAVETFITKRFPAELVRMKVGVVATAIALGLLIGLVAEALVRLRGAPLQRRSAWVDLLHALGLVAVLHALLVLRAMADTPQLYAADWYAQGGLARTVQLFATDWLGKGGIWLLAIGLAIAYVRPRRIAYLITRALVVVRFPWKLAAAEAARRSAAPLAMLVLAAVAFGEGTEPIVTTAHAAPPSASAPGTAFALGNDTKPLSFLILAADSLRADRLDPKIAPNLSALARRGTRFDRAYVSVPRTFPSWVTILTGRHNHHHGVRSMFPTWEERAKDFDALPQRFAQAGYSTVVVSDYAGDIFSRIDLGFQKIDTPSFDFRQVIRQKVLERETPLLPVLHSHVGRKLFPVMRELSAAADPMLLADDVDAALRSVKDKPFFMTVFFSTAHFPYAAPAPYYKKYTSASYRGRYKYHKPLGLGRASEMPPDADDVRQIQALYDGAVTGIDDGVGRILRTLDKLDMTEHTVILITADHGETLFDNDHGQGHGDHLFGDEGTHVPLVIYDPRTAKKKGAPAEGHRVASIVRDVDIAPTLYALANVAPPGDLDGRSVAGAIRGEPIDPRFAYAETELWFTEDIPALAPELRMPYPGVMGLTELDSRHNAEVVLRKEMLPQTLMARHRMVRDERFKLLYIPTRVGVRYMLFDTQQDPAETKDLAAALPNEVARLRAELWSWMLKDPNMEQKDGYLVPREGGAALARGAAASPPASSGGAKQP